MVGRLKLTLAALAATLLILPGFAQAQEGGRFQVLIPYFEPRDDADDDFGKDTSEKLRELINTLPTHMALEEDEIEDQAEAFNMDIDDLNCLFSIQLAAQLGVPVAICATYTEQEEAERTWTVNASIRTIDTSEEFVLNEFTVTRGDEDEAAAEEIFNQFDRYNTQVRSAAICNDYAASQQWDNALRNCDESLAINPDAMATRFMRGRVLYELERGDEALEEFDRVLEVDPFHEDALQLAGYIATVAGDDALGRDYYSRYLEINPGNEQIRMRIAYEIAQAGDPVGGMQFIQVGLDVDAESTDLLDQYAGFAFTAALNAQQEYEMVSPQAEGIAPEAAEYYREAIDAYTKVFEARGAETQPDRLRNIVAAHIQLEEFTEAISLSERILEVQPEEERIWSLYADALQRGERLDDAIAALGRLRELNPEHPTAALRQGNWLIQASRLEDAVGVLSEVAAGNPDQARQAATMIFNEAYQNGYQQDDFAYSISGMTAAKQLPNVPPEIVHQLNFWHGFSIHRAATAEQEAQTLETATATLPRFQQALALLNDTGEYPSSVNVDLSQLTTNIGTYIEIQEAIIQRGR